MTNVDIRNYHKYTAKTNTPDIHKSIELSNVLSKKHPKYVTPPDTPPRIENDPPLQPVNMHIKQPIYDVVAYEHTVTHQIFISLHNRYYNQCNRYDNSVRHFMVTDGVIKSAPQSISLDIGWIQMPIDNTLKPTLAKLGFQDIHQYISFH